MSRHARIEIQPVHPMSPLAEGKTPSGRPHYLRLVAANGQILATSETYANRTNARRAVASWATAFCDVTDAYPCSNPRVVEFAYTGDDKLDAHGPQQVRP